MIIVILGIASFAFLVLSVFLVFDVESLKLELLLERQTTAYLEQKLKANGIDINDLEQQNEP